jgi:hypothetical protein
MGLFSLLYLTSTSYSSKDSNLANIMHNTVKQPLNFDLDFTSEREAD